jgi:hypothetical protein
MDGSLSKYIAVHSATAVYHPPCQSIFLTWCRRESNFPDMVQKRIT